MDNIVIRGAREHNLKNIDLTIPRDKLIVFTGLSGSGKSSLAFDTIYAEGQRRYVESLSSYARQFIGQMEKPEVDAIEGLSPAISIDQKSTSNNPRSTVGTVTEIYDYLRLLYARCGTPHCPKCGRVIEKQSIDTVVDRVMGLPAGTRIQLLAPCVRGKKGEHAKVLEGLRKEGYVRARVDGEVYDLDEAPALDKQKKHTIEAVIDRLVVKAGRFPPGQEPGHRLRSGRGRHPLLPELRLPGLRHLLGGAGAPGLLLQQSLRRLPHLHGPRRAVPRGPGAGGAGQAAEPRSGRHLRFRLE